MPRLCRFQADGGSWRWALGGRLLELGPETFAAEARQRLGLGVRPVWDMVALLEEEGVFVVEASFESTPVRCLYLLGGVRPLRPDKHPLH